MGALEGNLSQNSDGSSFGASAVGWSPINEWFNGFHDNDDVDLLAVTRTFGDPAFDDEHHLKTRGVW